MTWLCASPCTEPRISILSNRAATSWWYFRGGKMIVSLCCTSQLNMFLKISKGEIAGLSLSLRLCFMTTNRPGLRIDCGECCVFKSCYISPPCMCNSYSNGRSCTVVVRGIGVGVGKCSGVRRIFTWISPNLTETFCASFAHKFSPKKSMKTCLWGGLQKRSQLRFSANVGSHFLK